MTSTRPPIPVRKRRGQCVIASTLLLLAGCDTKVSFERDDSFDRDDWQDSGCNTTLSDQSPAAKRRSMIPQLEARFLRVGMSETEVIALLGEPDGIDTRGGRLLGYCLGTAIIDADEYIVSIGPDGRVLRYWISPG